VGSGGVETNGQVWVLPTAPRMRAIRLSGSPINSEYDYLIRIVESVEI